MSLDNKDTSLNAYNESEFTDEFLNKMDKLTRNNVLCDIILVAEGVEFPIHKHILSESNIFFKKLLKSESGFIEGANDRIQMNEIQSDVLSEIIQFSYTKKANITNENVQSLYIASHLMEYESLWKLCSVAICKLLNHETCLSLLDFALLYEDKNVIDCAFSCIGCNFSKINSEEKFLSINYNKLVLILNRTEVVYENEIPIFQGIINWINEKKDEREKYLLDLLKYVKFSNLPIKFLDNITSNIEMYNMKNKDCLGMIIEGYKNKAMLKTTIIGFNNTEMVYRDTSVYSKAISKSIKFPTERKEYSLVTLDNTIYILGGVINEEKTNSVMFFDLLEQCWLSVCPMSHNRASFESNVINGKIYVVGGLDNNSAEMYDPLTNEWTFIPEMLHNDVYRTVVYRGVLYVIGNIQKNKTRNVQSFDAIQNYWTEEPPLTLCKESENYLIIDDSIIYYEPVLKIQSGYLFRVFKLRTGKNNPISMGVFRTKGILYSSNEISNQCIRLDNQISHIIDKGSLDVHALYFRDLNFIIVVESPLT